MCTRPHVDSSSPRLSGRTSSFPSASHRRRRQPAASLPNSCDELRRLASYHQGASEEVTRSVEVLRAQAEERTREICALGAELAVVTHERDTLVEQQSQGKRERSQLKAAARDLREQLAAERGRSEALMKHIQEQHVLLDAQQRLVRQERRERQGAAVGIAERSEERARAGAGADALREGHRQQEHNQHEPGTPHGAAPSTPQHGGVTGTLDLWQALTRLYVAPDC